MRLRPKVGYLSALLVLSLCSGFLFLMSEARAAEQPLVGELRTRITFQPEWCKIVKGSIICPPVEEKMEESQPLDFKFQTVLNLTFAKIFGTPQDFVRSSTIFFIPGLEFQSFVLQIPLSELLFFKNSLVFSNRVRQFDFETGEMREIGSITDPIVFRKDILEMEVGLPNFLLYTAFLIDNLSQPSQPAFETGLIIDLSGPLIGGATVGLTAYFGATDGLECFGTCTQREEIFPQGITKPGGLRFQKEVLAIEGIRISDIVFKGEAVWLPEGLNSIGIKADTHLTLLGIDFRTRAELVIPEIAEFRLSKVVLRSTIRLSDELLLDMLLVDSGGDLIFEQRAFLFGFYHEAIATEVLFYFQDSRQGSQFTFDWAEMTADVDRLFKIIAGFSPLPGGGGQKFRSISFVYSHKFLRFPPFRTFRWTLVGAFSEKAGGGAVDFILEF